MKLLDTILTGAGLVGFLLALGLALWYYAQPFAPMTDLN